MERGLIWTCLSCLFDAVLRHEDEEDVGARRGGSICGRRRLRHLPCDVRTIEAFSNGWRVFNCLMNGERFNFSFLQQRISNISLSTNRVGADQRAGQLARRKRHDKDSADTMAEEILQTVDRRVAKHAALGRALAGKEVGLLMVVPFEQVEIQKKQYLFSSCT